MKDRRRPHAVVFVLGLFVCLIGPAAHPGDCPEPVGRWPYGPASAVAAVADHLYYGSGAALVVAALDESGLPQVVGDLALSDTVRALAVNDGYAYVVTTYGLHVVDVTDSSAPIEVGTYTTRFWDWASSVAVAQGFAFMATHSGLYVVDVRTPSQPVGSLYDTGNAEFVAATESQLYVLYLRTSNYRTRLFVYDLSDPSAPDRIAIYQTLGDTKAVAVSGHHAYLADFQHGLRVLDVSDPSAPVEVGFVDTPRRAYDVAVAGDLACVADLDSLRLIDVGDPTAPVELGFVEIPGFALKVTQSRDVAYVGAGPDGVRVIDVSAPVSPIELTVIKSPGSIWGLAAANGHAYLAEDSGVRVIETAGPAPFREVGWLRPSGVDRFGSRLASSAGWVYVVSPNGLSILDAREPSAPVEVGFLGIGLNGFTYEIAVSDEYVYIADSSEPEGGTGLRVISVADPTAPQEVGALPDLRAAPVVAGAGFLYAGCLDSAGSSSALCAIDVRDPTSPVVAGSCSPCRRGGVAGLFRSGEWIVGACVDGWQVYGGMGVVDVRVPTAPTVVAYHPLFFGATDVTIAGNLAVAANYDKVVVFDVSTPVAPVRMSAYRPSGFPVRLALDGHRLHVVFNESGFEVLDLTSCQEFVPSPKNPDGRSRP